MIVEAECLHSLVYKLASATFLMAPAIAPRVRDRAGSRSAHWSSVRRSAESRAQQNEVRRVRTAARRSLAERHFISALRHDLNRIDAANFLPRERVRKQNGRRVAGLDHELRCLHVAQQVRPAVGINVLRGA